MLQVEGSAGETGDPYLAVSSLVTEKAFIDVAEASQIVWGKVGKYPHWPVSDLIPCICHAISRFYTVQNTNILQILFISGPSIASR